MLLVHVVAQPYVHLPVGARRVVSAQDLRAARICACLGGEIVGLVKPRRVEIHIVGQRENVEDGFAYRCEALRRDDIAGKGRLAIQRILDGDQGAIGVVVVREVARPFRRRGHRHRLGAVGDALVLKLLREKEEQLGAVAV